MCVMFCPACSYTFGHRCHHKCLRWIPNTPGQWRSQEHKMWVSLFKELEGHYLHPIGLQMRVNARSSDIRQWRTDYIWWRGTTFQTMEQFQASASRRQVNLDPKRDPHDVNSTTLFSSMHFRGDPVPRRAQKGPRTFLPDGRRYTVQGHHVAWQGWEFNFGVSSVTGLHLNDIRFRNERIIYEIGLQELAVFYSGGSPVPLHNAFFDSFLNIGRYTYSLIPGLDCPHHATYFDMVHYIGGESIVYRDSVCVFEHTNAMPLRRHFESDYRGGYEWVQGMDDKVLILRAITTLANYEYIVDYEFHQNGGVEVRLAMTGYVLASYYTSPDEDRYGFQMFDNVIANIHHHAANFKVDLDINGERNRVETLDIKANKVMDSTDRSYMYANEFVRTLKKFEMDSLTTFSEQEPKYMIFHNQQKTNEFQQPRAYRLLPEGTQVTLPGMDWKLQKAASWTKYHVSPLT
jgi:diamine oxidase